MRIAGKCQAMLPSPVCGNFKKFRGRDIDPGNDPQLMETAISGMVGEPKIEGSTHASGVTARRRNQSKTMIDESFTGVPKPANHHHQPSWTNKKAHPAAPRHNELRFQLARISACLVTRRASDLLGCICSWGVSGSGLARAEGLDSETC